MPNIKSAKKRELQTIKRTARNLARRSALKTAIKKVVKALADKNIVDAKALLKDAESKISRAKGKGLLHANTAARKVSRLAKKVAASAREAQ